MRCGGKQTNDCQRAVSTGEVEKAPVINTGR